MKEQFKNWLEKDCSYIEVNFISDMQYVALCPFLYTYAIITGTIQNYYNFDNRWCYESKEKAFQALNQWLENKCQGEPEGWHRQPATGRRRPDGDQLKEYINF